MNSLPIPTFNGSIRINPNLLNELHRALHGGGCHLRTRESCINSIGQFISFNDQHLPDEITEVVISAFPAHPAVSVKAGLFSSIPSRSG